MDLLDFARFASLFPAGFGSTSFTDSPGACSEPSSSNSLVAVAELLDRCRVERILNLSEKSSCFLSLGQYDEAFGLLQTSYELGPDVQFATVLIESFITAMATDRPDKAEKFKEELQPLIIEKFKVDVEDVGFYGMKLLLQKNFFKAILFIKICYGMLKEEQNNEIAIRFLSLSIAGSSEVIMNLVERKQMSKSNVKKYILPQVYEMLQIVGTKTQADSKEACFFIGASWRSVALCEIKLGDEEKEMDALKKAVNLFQSVLGNDAAHNIVFRECLVVIAERHFEKERFRDAAKAFSASIDATKRADTNTFISPLVKQQEVTQLEEKLFLVRARLEMNM